ncbi:alanyl-tRNA editing protein [Heyndrickxia sporothermodurans]
MSIKLYYTSPNIFEWKTKITNKYEEKNRLIVTLEQTNFYPEGGGQPFDYGTIDGINIIEVFEKNNEVFHVLNGMPQQTEVTCKVEKNRRIEHSQHHTGQHLLSAVCLELFNIPTVSFHLGSDVVTIDLDIPDLSEEKLFLIENRVNEYIYENRNIHSYFVTKQQMSKIPLTKVPDISGDIRIVEIEGIDYSACCGTHVSQTGEIGLLKILKAEKHRGKTRVYFKCGLRAKKDYHEKHQILTEITKKFSSPIDLVLQKIIKLESEQKSTEKKLENALSENAKLKASEILLSSKKGVIIERFEEKSIKEIQLIALEISKKTSTLIILVSLQDNKLVMIHNGLTDFHCGKWLNDHLKKFHGKGGGDANKAQAIFNQADDLNEFINYTEEYINRLTIV